MIEYLQRTEVPIRGFTMSNSSKLKLIDALSLGFERQQFLLLNDETQIAELEAFEQSTLEVSGLIRFASPAGIHDDCVIGTALAWKAAQSEDWSFLASTEEKSEEVPFSHIMHSHRAGQRVADYGRTHGFSDEEDEELVVL